ncbi:hypothetical protein HDK77DRAFT_22165 [Phyllosticta capitalensis]
MEENAFQNVHNLRLLSVHGLLCLYSAAATPALVRSSRLPPAARSEKLRVAPARWSTFRLSTCCLEHLRQQLATSRPCKSTTAVFRPASVNLTPSSLVISSAPIPLAPPKRSVTTMATPPDAGGYQQDHQYIRTLDEGRGSQRRRGIWVGDVAVESPDTLRSVLEVNNGPLLLLNGIESLLQRNRLLEMTLRHTKKELADLKAKDSASGISAQPLPQAQQESRVSTTAPIGSDASDLPLLAPLDSLVRPRKEHLSTQSHHHEAPSQPSALPTQDEPAPGSEHHIRPSFDVISPEPFRFTNPESPCINSTQKAFGTPRSQTPQSQDKPQSDSFPTGKFTFHLPMHPSPLRKAVTQDEGTVGRGTLGKDTIEDDTVGKEMHCGDVSPQTETAPSGASDIESACHDILQEDASGESLTEFQQLFAFPDPAMFSGNPSTFHVFDTQVLLKFAMDGASFPTRADRYEYLMSRLEGDALQVARQIAGNWAKDRKSLDSGVAEEPWMVIMTVLSAAYGRPPSPSPEGMDDSSEDWGTTDESLHDDELRPKPEVFTSEPYILTEEEAWAAAEKMAGRQLGHD